MEESAIKRGFDELRDGSDYDSLYDSALCRAKADWLIGINATRLFSTIHGKTLNVGRVQSPTLAMLVDRQEKIMCFRKEKYHIVRLKMDGIEAVSEHIPDIETANNIMAACLEKQAVCVSLIKERKTIAPPKLFDLTSLQRESNRLFGFTAKQTLDSAQKLYENKLITYPRTDSRYLTSDMAQGVTSIALSAAAYIGARSTSTVFVNMPIRTNQVVNDKKVSDHHAIIPTSFIGSTSASGLDVAERKIFHLIATRFICALGDRQEYDAITAVFDCNNQTFTAKGRVIISEGWKEVDNHFRSVMKLKETGTGTDEDIALPQIMEGQVFGNATAAVTEHFTKPPVPYTENTLLSAMEKAGADETDKDAERVGLGTPATRAAIIEKLVSGGFAFRKGRQLLPTAAGENLVKILPESLKSASLTAEWENELLQIAKGEASPDGFMRKIEDMTRNLVEKG